MVSAVARFCQYKHGGQLREKALCSLWGKVVPQEGTDRGEDWQVDVDRDKGALLRLKNNSNMNGYFYFAANSRLEVKEAKRKKVGGGRLLEVDTLKSAQVISCIKTARKLRKTGVHLFNKYF